MISNHFRNGCLGAIHTSFGYHIRQVQYKARGFATIWSPFLAKKVRHYYCQYPGVQTDVKSALALKPNIQYSGSSLKRSRLPWRMTSVYSAKVLSSLRILGSQREAQPPLQPPRAEWPPIPREQIWRVSTPPHLTHTLSVRTEVHQILFAYSEFAVQSYSTTYTKLHSQQPESNGSAPHLALGDNCV